MSETNKRHPHAYTLELLRIAIQQLPPGISRVDHELYDNKLREFLSDPDVSYDEIHEVVVELGRSSWPQRRAFEEMYNRYGRSSEESYLLDKLDKGVRKKYEKFIGEGGKLNYVMEARRAEDMHKPSPFARYFDPEERFAISQALIDARNHAREEISSLATGKKADEYNELVQEYAKRQEQILQGLDELSRLADVSEKWKGEIEQQVELFREGWSVVERPVYRKDVQGALDYWRGTLESFLKTA